MHDTPAISGRVDERAACSEGMQSGMMAEAEVRAEGLSPRLAPVLRPRGRAPIRRGHLPNCHSLLTPRPSAGCKVRGGGIWVHGQCRFDDALRPQRGHVFSPAFGALLFAQLTTGAPNTSRLQRLHSSETRRPFRAGCPPRRRAGGVAAKLRPADGV